MIKWPFKKKNKATKVKTTLIQLAEVDSTNSYLHQYTPATDENMTVVSADFQTAGRGQGTHTWESEWGKNLLFSILTHPMTVPLRSQFILSEAGALALKEVLRSEEHTSELQSRQYLVCRLLLEKKKYTA